MKESKPHQFYSFLKRWFINTIFISPVTFLQFYWSMGTFSDRVSSGCIDCSFFKDAVSLSLIAGGFLSIVFSLLFFVKKIFLKASVEFLLLALVWLFWNYAIFTGNLPGVLTISIRKFNIQFHFPCFLLLCWDVCVF